MNKTVFALALAGIAATVAGCATKSHYVDATDTTQAVLNTNRMSSADWVIIVQEAGNALLSSPALQDYLSDYRAQAEMDFTRNPENDGKVMASRLGRPLLMLSTVGNETGEHIDTRLLTERLRELLFNSNKVRFTTYSAGAGQTIDSATGDARDLRHDPNVNQSTVAPRGAVNAYDLQLAGVIIRQTARDGRENEISYTFSLTLTDTLTGEGVWAYTKEIKRQNTKAGFGW